MSLQSPPDPRVIAAGLLGDERLLRACAEREMGAVLRILTTPVVSAQVGSPLPSASWKVGSTIT